MSRCELSLYKVTTDCEVTKGCFPVVSVSVFRSKFFDSRELNLFIGQSEIHCQGSHMKWNSKDI